MAPLGGGRAAEKGSNTVRIWMWLGEVRLGVESIGICIVVVVIV